MNRKRIGRALDRARLSDEYWETVPAIEFTEELQRVMRQQRISQVELARLRDCSPAHISKLLAGEHNFTLRSMAGLASAIGQKVHVHLAPRNVSVRWIDEHNHEPPLTVEVESREASGNQGLQIGSRRKVEIGFG